MTLTTDFGVIDSYVGQLKGAILSLAPSVTLVDITHSIPSFDIDCGARVLAEVIPRFPSGTVHVAVVDPGVGTPRRRVIVEGRVKDTFLVGPDNGLLTLAAAPMPRTWEIVHFDLLPPFAQPSTFEGRDIFGPVAALLSNGIPPEQFGPAIPGYSLVSSPSEEADAEGRPVGKIVGFDAFGNALTTLRPPQHSWKGIKLPYHSRLIPRADNYMAIAPGSLGAVVGSQGFLELAARNASSLTVLPLVVGEPVEMEDDTQRV